MDALKDRPVGLFQMDDTTPLQDYSGYNATATITGGTPFAVPPFVKGASYAPVFTSTITAAYNSQVFKKNLEEEPFTLGAWFRVVSGASEQQVLGNPGQLDGITVNGTTIYFVTKYTTAPEARCSYDIGQTRAVCVFGVHTENKNSLYVNGELVDEVTLTDVQQADTFASTGTQLATGATAGAQNLAVNNIAMYGQALTADSIKRQYAAGTDVPTAADVVQVMGGDLIPVTLSNAVVFLDQKWTTATDWNTGQQFNVVVANDQLAPQFQAGNSIAGKWLTNFNLGAAGVSSIYGVVVNWEGQGATVEVSLDGTTWETVTRGAKCTTVSSGMDPTDKILHVRVSFPGGIPDDPAYVDNLNIVGITSGVSNTVAGRTVTFVNSTPKRDYPPLVRHDNWGADLATGGTITVSADTSAEASPIRTVEVWVKRTSATNITISASGTVYQNGVANASALTQNQWTLFHVVAAANITGTLTVTGPGQIGHIAVYPTALTAGDIAKIYAAYSANNAQRITDASIISVTEVAAPVSIYAHDWTIKSAG